MNFISAIKNLFLKDKKLNLIDINDILQIPDRAYYKDDLDKIKLIDLYKEQYNEILSKRKIKTSKELKLDNLQDKMIMYTDLLFHDILILEDYRKLANEELMIQMLKLKLFFSEILTIENEAITRLIALKEIKKSDKVLPQNKSSLNEEINNLTFSLIVFLNSRNAIVREIDTFLTMIEINDNVKDEKLLDEVYSKLIYISEDIVPNNINNINDLIAKIAYLEKKLKIYAYTHDDEIGKLKEELENLRTIKKDKENKNELLNKILLLEKKYLKFYEYGINKISKDEMEKLFEVKFDILTSDIDNLKQSPIKKEDLGYEYYKDIISSKFEKIILGKNDIFNENFKEDLTSAITYIKRYYKNKEGEYNFDEVLTNKYFLNLLLCFDKENGFDEMLENNKLSPNCNDGTISISDYKIDGIKWNKDINLNTILELICNTSISNEIDLIWNLYNMRNAKQDSTDSYYLPDGIISIDSDKISYNIKDNIRKKSNSKKLIMPDTLKNITGDLFNGNYTELKLNDGLEYIGVDSFLGLNTSSLVIPPSIKEINDSFSKYKIKNIIFKDYTNSELLRDKESVNKFLKQFTRLNVERNRYKILCKSECILERIFFVDNMNNTIMIDNKDMIFSEKINYTILPERYYIEFELKNTDYLIDKLRKIIFEKIKYKTSTEDIKEKNKKLILNYTSMLIKMMENN